MDKIPVDFTGDTASAAGAITDAVHLVSNRFSDRS
jgi:hypothetical protein